MSAQTISGVGAEIAPRTGLAPQALSGSSDVNGTGIDRLGFNSCKLVAKTGATTGTPTSFTVAVRLQHSDAVGSGYTDFTPSVPNPGGTGAITPLAAANAIRDRSIDLKTAKRFIRAVATPAFVGGTSPTVLADVSVILGGADVLPIADQ
jgi:hypothetical protein